MKRLLILAALAVTAWADTQRFAACLNAPTCANVTLAASATALTVQQPAVTAGVPGVAMQLESATIYCSVACSVTQRQNETTAATATASTPKAIAPVNGAPNGTAYSASNASGGTVIPPVLTLPAGSTITLDLSSITLPAGNAKSSYTVAIASLTGDVNITIVWKEVQ